MAKKIEANDSKTKIEKYFAAAPSGQRATLKKIRQLIRDSAPEAIENFSYRIPGFKYKGKPLVWYAAFEDHYSLFPTGEGVEAHKSELKGYKVSKGTIQFFWDKPIPLSLIRKIIKTRIKQMESQEKADRAHSSARY